MDPFKMYMNGCITVQQIYMKFGVAQNPIVAASFYFCGTEAPLVFGLHIVLCHQISPHSNVQWLGIFKRS